MAASPPLTFLLRSLPFSLLGTVAWNPRRSETGGGCEDGPPGESGMWIESNEGTFSTIWREVDVDLRGKEGKASFEMAPWPSALEEATPGRDADDDDAAEAMNRGVMIVGATANIESRVTSREW